MSEKKQAWFDAVQRVDGYKARIAEMEELLAGERAAMTLAAEGADKSASDYAAERAAEGANAVEGPDGALYTIRKARKRKGGAEPVNPYVLEPVKR